MTRLMRPAALVLLVVACTLPIAADQAKSWYQKGQDAEARQNFEQAYDDYKQAYDLSPKNLRYRSSFERLRFLAGASHVHRGKLLREAGKLEEALAELQLHRPAGDEGDAEDDRGGAVAGAALRGAATWPLAAAAR
jgi:tetratricopeptide (TPR) repeat protein